MMPLHKLLKLVKDLIAAGYDPALLLACFRVDDQGGHPHARNNWHLREHAPVCTRV